jgi:hypothetical protein
VLVKKGYFFAKTTWLRVQCVRKSSSTEQGNFLPIECIHNLKVQIQIIPVMVKYQMELIKRLIRIQKTIFWSLLLHLLYSGGKHMIWAISLGVKNRSLSCFAHSHWDSLKTFTFKLTPDCKRKMFWLAGKTWISS